MEVDLMETVFMISSSLVWILQVEGIWNLEGGFPFIISIQGLGPTFEASVRYFEHHIWYAAYMGFWFWNLETYGCTPYESVTLVLPSDIVLGMSFTSCHSRVVLGLPDSHKWMGCFRIIIVKELKRQTQRTFFAISKL